MTHALEAAAMSRASINDLRDDQFAYIEEGGSKDATGRTVPRSLRHFPIHDAAHVRNALARAPQSPFGDKAMPAIRAACKRFGIRWEGMDEKKKSKVYASAAPDLHGVELARPGPWRLSTGQSEFTAENLRDAADFFTASGGQAVPIKLGHHDERFDGEPTFGLVTNVRYHEDTRGPVLLGDIIGMPNWLAAAAPSRWPNRSVEGWQNVEFDGREYSLILSGLAFLGATPPGVRNIASLADLQTALAASAAIRVIASAPEDDTATPPPDPAEPDPAQPPDPAVEAVVPTEEKEAGMDPAKIRERLGLDDDVSDDDVMAALAYAGFVPAPEPGEAVSDQRVAAAAARDGGVVTIDRAQLQAFEEGMRRAESLVKRLDAQERDTTITAAVREGKFPPARRAHYERAWDADPKGTKELIGTLAAGLVPVTASGYSGGPDEFVEDELDREIARLSAPNPKVG